MMHTHQKSDFFCRFVSEFHDRQRARDGIRYLDREVQMLSSTSEYALRALVVLSGAAKGQSMQARALARATEVPPSYLYKILAALRRANLLAGTRGSHGGYCLARDPREVRLVDVVSLFETVRPTEACLLRESHMCDEKEPCSAHHHWKDVQLSYHEFLETKTIADLAKRPSA